MYLGDGYIYKERNKNRYQIGFVGSPQTDVELFENLKFLIKNEWGKEVKFGVRARGLRMVFRLKKMSDFLVKGLGLPFGRGKCQKVMIPETIVKDLKLVRHTIRGIVDTDGSVFVSKKPGIEKYPAIEITTTGGKLAFQPREVLLKLGFRVASRVSKSRGGNLPAYRIALYGKENIKKWLEEIGFSNKYKLERAKSYIQ